MKSNYIRENFEKINVFPNEIIEKRTFNKKVLTKKRSREISESTSPSKAEEILILSEDSKSLEEFKLMDQLSNPEIIEGIIKPIPLRREINPYIDLCEDVSNRIYFEENCPEKRLISDCQKKAEDNKIWKPFDNNLMSFPNKLCNNCHRKKSNCMICQNEIELLEQLLIACRNSRNNKVFLRFLEGNLLNKNENVLTFLLKEIKSKKINKKSKKQILFNNSFCFCSECLIEISTSKNIFYFLYDKLNQRISKSVFKKLLINFYFDEANKNIKYLIEQIKQETKCVHEKVKNIINLMLNFIKIIDDCENKKKEKKENQTTLSYYLLINNEFIKTFCQSYYIINKVNMTLCDLNNICKFFEEENILKHSINLLFYQNQFNMKVLINSEKMIHFIENIFA